MITIFKQYNVINNRVIPRCVNGLNGDSLDSTFRFIKAIFITKHICIMSSFLLFLVFRQALVYIQIFNCSLTVPFSDIIKQISYNLFRRS